MTSNQSLELYNKAFEQFTPDSFSESKILLTEKYIQENIKSLKEFISSYFSQVEYKSDWAGISVCETGCGLAGISQWLNTLCATTTAIDFSPLALSLAKTYSELKQSPTEFLNLDLRQNNLTAKYDVIIDSHLLHCLVNKDERMFYLRNLKDALKNENSRLLIETMTYHKNMQVPFDYEYDEDQILWQHNEKFTDKIPLRKIARSENIENEIIAAGFKIKYLYYHPEMTFQVFQGYPHYNPDHLPRVLRIAASI
jgi:2-polyprenyl-3-methyl-5-hydroxy-6-metoxy-1,4-benzoquinol methylase